MKRMKKLLAVLLAVVMVMTMGSMSVLADELTVSATSYSITVVSGKAGRTYTAYQLFSGTLDKGNLTDIGGGSNLDIYGTDGNEDQSKIDSLSADLRSESTPISIGDYSTVGALVTDKLVNYTPSAIADFLTEYGAQDSNVLVGFANVSANHITGTGVSSTSYTDNNNGTYSYKISGLEAGYYLIVEKTATVTGDSYSRYMLSMSGTEDNVVINSKEVVPTLTKELVNETDVSSASKTVGDTIKYQLSADVPDTTGYSSYTFEVTDTISDGLKLDTSTIKVAIGSATLTNGKKVESTEVSAIENNETDMSDYSYYYYTTTDSYNNTILNIVFVDFLTLARTYYVADANPAVAVTIDYSATLTSDAAVGSAGNSNTATLTYSNNPSSTATSETTPDKVVVYTYELDFTKKDAMNGAVLSDAKFYLYRYAEDGRTKEYAVVSKETDTTKYTITEWKTITDVSSELTKVSITSGTDGTFKILGLGTGTFYLCEYEAPSGYTEFADKKIVIEAETEEQSTDTFLITSLSATIDDSADVISGNELSGVLDGTVSIVVTNSNSTAIPSTGGIGTTIFYIVGAILVLGAGVILITRRRMASR